MNYYGTRLSGNLSRREPEGYLICLNVPVARSGTQLYLPEELGLPPGPDAVPVFRPEEEVFSPACMASFEGMPVTDGHPYGPEGVTAENIRALQKGHAHNVRRGTGKEADLLLADLIITDPALIARVLEGGRREISCGYNYELCEERGGYVQRQIRGNHVAVVDAGRAGHRVCIKDRKPERRRENMNMDRNTRALARALTRMAADGQTEEVAGLLNEVLDPGGTEAPALPGPGAPESPAPDYGAEVLARLDTLIALLTASAADEEPGEEAAPAAEEAAEALEEAAEAMAEAADPLEELAEELSAAPETPEEPAPADPAEDECGEEPDRQAADAMRAVIRAVRPVLAQLPAAARDRASADLARGLRAAAGRPAAAADAYAALRGAGKPKADPSDLGRRIMKNRNVNWKG